MRALGVRTVPPGAYPRRSSSELLAAAWEGLARAAAMTGTDPGAAGGCYAQSHLAALRAASALLAARARPARAGGRTAGSGSVWSLLPSVAPTLAEEAAFFAAAAPKRAAVENGRPGAVTRREADDLLRDAHRFLGLVQEALGGSPQLPLPCSAAP